MQQGMIVKITAANSVGERGGSMTSRSQSKNQKGRVNKEGHEKKKVVVSEWEV